MLSVREIPLPDDARRVLEGLIAAAPAPAAGFWSRLKSAAALDRKFHAERAAQARVALALGRCEEVEVRHDTAPALSEHEHGIFLFVPVDAGTTLLLDVCSVADDARWALHQAGQLLRQHWRWLRFTGLDGPWCFVAKGAPVTPRDLGEFHGTALEHRLTEETTWLGDDALLPLSMAEIERLARQHAAAA
jgi:hypothetical protein